MSQKKPKLRNFYENFKRDMEQCEFCNKKGKIKHAGSLFCSHEHVKLYDRKWKDAEKRMKGIKTCSICSKPVGNSKWTMIDCRIKKITDNFMPHRFCSEKCWDEWGAE